MDLIASWGVSKIADAVWSKISGRGPSNALQAGLSIALQEFRGAHPKVHANLFEQDLFWDALQEEIILLLQPETQPDAKRLAQRMQPLVAWPIDRLERALDDLFRMIRQECRRQPDLITVEQFRIALGAQGRLDELWAWLGPEPDIDKIATKAWQAALSDLKSFGSFLGVSCPTPALSLSLAARVHRTSPTIWVGRSSRHVAAS